MLIHLSVQSVMHWFLLPRTCSPRGNRMLKGSVSACGLQKCQIWLAKQNTSTGNEKKEGGNNRKSGSYRKMRNIKKCLRSEQRKLEAQKRNNRMTEIMELSETNDKKFYSLVNHQRQQNSLITSKLKYNDKIAECDEAIVETWAEYLNYKNTMVDGPFSVIINCPSKTN